MQLIHIVTTVHRRVNRDRAVPYAQVLEIRTIQGDHKRCERLHKFISKKVITTLKVKLKPIRRGEKNKLSELLFTVA
jgi:hypothetical protein